MIDRIQYSEFIVELGAESDKKSKSLSNEMFEQYPECLKHNQTFGYQPKYLRHTQYIVLNKMLEDP